ncbi:MAG: hypothetical protein NUV63_12260 [Gallionella sp.]|nr:hypothetical protein [Gallionella sp.]
MKTLLGKIACFLLRKHKFRRLRKAEKTACTGFPEHERICNRCHIVRAVKPHKTA